MSRSVGGIYIEQNFQPDDRLAVVLINRRTNAVIQHLARAEHMMKPHFQEWLTRENNRAYDVYLSMNALKSDAEGRTKQDVATVRHIYLDFDENGTAAVQNLLHRWDVPVPHFLLRTSPDKWQVIWKANGFSKHGAENLQRGLARDAGADPAATDCARVMRLPGFDNHKYSMPWRVEAEALSIEPAYSPLQFPVFAPSTEPYRTARVAPAPSTATRITQSEKDWAYALRSLRRGESPDTVVAAIASYRRYDKPDPEYYARLTVQKASVLVQYDKGHQSPGPSRA